MLIYKLEPSNLKKRLDGLPNMPYANIATETKLNGFRNCTLFQRFSVTIHIWQNMWCNKRSLTILDHFLNEAN